tara:strand:- start:241 stop:891 length:651 start_codon:yes stop_codon:yes gene_type:complete
MMNVAAPLAMELFKAKPKERSDMILEPLHVIIGIAMLGFCPEGTKLTIGGNLLYLQKPTWTQGIRRWYHQDTKDDLFYLFHAIRRYYKWYKEKDDIIFNYILELSKKGIQKLMDTYSSHDKKSIQHTLALYKNMLNLNSHELFKDTDEDMVTLDEVFQNITEIYDKKTLYVIYNTFKLLETASSEQDRISYIKVLRNIMMPINRRIQIWMEERMRF